MVLVYCVAVLFGLNGFLKTFFLRKKFYGVWGSALTKKLLRTVFASFFKCRLLSGRFFLVLFTFLLTSVNCHFRRKDKREERTEMEKSNLPIGFVIKQREQASTPQM